MHAGKKGLNLTLSWYLRAVIPVGQPSLIADGPISTASEVGIRLSFFSERNKKNVLIHV